MKKKVNIAVLIVNIVIITFALICYFIVIGLKNNYAITKAADTWSSDNGYSYAQISAYFSENANITLEDIYAMENAIEEELQENSIVANENSRGRLWLDTYYCEESFTITSDRTSINATISGTNGDFFLFHSFDLLYGSYYSDDDTNYDRIILDATSSWQLFGALNTVGMSVTIGDKIFYVAGVVDTPSSEYSTTAYGNTLRAYIPTEAMRVLCNGELPCITVYEACLPDPVSDFAYNTMRNAISTNENQVIIINQSSRFDIVKLITNYSSIYEDLMQTKAITLTWFENATYSATIKATVLMGISSRAMIIVLVSLVYGIFLLVKAISKLVKHCYNKAYRKYQAKIARAYRIKKGIEE